VGHQAPPHVVSAAPARLDARRIRRHGRRGGGRRRDPRPRGGRGRRRTRRRRLRPPRRVAKVVPLNSPHTLFPSEIVIMLMAALIL
jgi:hypothetical protein